MSNDGKIIEESYKCHQYIKNDENVDELCIIIKIVMGRIKWDRFAQSHSLSNLYKYLELVYP